jgi:hypothetical protein
MKVDPIEHGICHHCECHTAALFPGLYDNGQGMFWVDRKTLPNLQAEQAASGKASTSPSIIGCSPVYFLSILTGSYYNLAQASSNTSQLIWF